MLVELVELRDDLGGKSVTDTAECPAAATYVRDTRQRQRGGLDLEILNVGIEELKVAGMVSSCSDGGRGGWQRRRRPPEATH
jgi:hypothetical protein